MKYWYFTYDFPIEGDMLIRSKNFNRHVMHVMHCNSYYYFRVTLQEADFWFKRYDYCPIPIMELQQSGVKWYEIEDWVSVGLRWKYVRL